MPKSADADAPIVIVAVAVVACIVPAAQSTMRIKHVLTRTTASDEPVMARVRAIARELDPGVHLGEVVLMSDALARESAPWRFAMRVLTFFGGLAAVLATIGLIGIMWLVVETRLRELGVREALGVTPNQLRRARTQGCTVDNQRRAGPRRPWRAGSRPRARRAAGEYISA
jgi:hypothetical protein